MFWTQKWRWIENITILVVVIFFLDRTNITIEVLTSAVMILIVSKAISNTLKKDILHFLIYGVLCVKIIAKRTLMSTELFLIVPLSKKWQRKCLINHIMCLLLIVISSCLCVLPWRCRGHKCIVKDVFVFSKFSPFYFLHLVFSLTRCFHYEIHQNNSSKPY